MGVFQLPVHQSQEVPADIPSPEDCVHIPIGPFLVLKKLRSFNKGSGAGPTGIHPSYIGSAIQVQNQTSTLEILTDFVNHLAKGLVPSDVQPFIAGAFLVGIGKKDGGIRPIAIGDVFLRLT